MITRCFTDSGLFELNEFGFVTDTIRLYVLTFPLIIGFTLWRIFITNKVGPRGDITVLGLDDSLSIYSERGQCRLSRYIRCEYVLVGVLTFALGLMTFEMSKALLVLFVAPTKTEFLRN